MLRLTVLGDKHPVRARALFAPKNRRSRPDPSCEGTRLPQYPAIDVTLCRKCGGRMRVLEA